MLVFIKSAENLTAKLIAICALNVTDMLLTIALVSTGAFAEGNPVMAQLMDSTPAALALKLIAPALLAALLILRLRGATPRQRKTANVLICTLLAFYALVNLSHIVWGSVYLALQPLA
ncbi:MAG: DUF5658 family protein [Bacillota bacterium]